MRSALVIVLVLLSAFEGGCREPMLDPCAIEKRPASPAGLWSCDPTNGEWTLIAESTSGEMYAPMRPLGR